MIDRIRKTLLAKEKLDKLFSIAMTDSPKRWSALRNIHAIIESEGIKHAYPVDWMRLFTPIEVNAWSGFRDYGIPMQPQYPVRNFFVDFANPEKRIVFECDGKAFHDKAKDMARDADCAKDGWIVFRATGSDCHRIVAPPWEMTESQDELIDNQDAALDWLNKTSDGLIFAISRWFFHPERGVNPFTKSQIYSRLCSASTTFLAVEMAQESNRGSL